jgi:hypothetical protein
VHGRLALFSHGSLIDRRSGEGVIMPGGKPHILVIWGDDIGISNLSCYSDGMLGYRTPNIDQIVKKLNDFLAAD